MNKVNTSEALIYLAYIGAIVIYVLIMVAVYLSFYHAKELLLATCAVFFLLNVFLVYMAKLIGRTFPQHGPLPTDDFLAPLPIS